MDKHIVGTLGAALSANGDANRRESEHRRLLESCQ